jgi:tetratricopeptide (TPR) repeat protein
LLGRSGELDARGDLDEGAHLVRAQPVDGAARPLERRDPQHMRGVAFDASLSPSEPQVIRYQLPARTARVEARLLYRKFSAAYARRACQALDGIARSRCQAIPIIEVASATLFKNGRPVENWRHLVAYGLGLGGALADHASEAQPVLERARALAPDRVEPVVAQLRLAVKLGRTDEAIALAARARSLDPSHPAADFFEATALFDAYRMAQARVPVERLLERLPDDRAALSLAARVRGLNGDALSALDAADRLLAVDPFLDEGYYQRALALADLHRAADAARAEEQYLYHRVAGEIDLDLRHQLCARRPDLPDESVPLHTHKLH